MIAVALAMIAATAGPLDGRYSLATAPGQCLRPAGELDGPMLLSPGRLDAYEQLCEWGALHKDGPDLWTAKGRCVAEGRESPGAFRFALKGEMLSLQKPDGSNTALRRCAGSPPAASVEPAARSLSSGIRP